MIRPQWCFGAIFLSTLFLFGCVEDKDYGQANALRPQENAKTPVNINSNANIAEDNELKLSELVNIPFEPAQDAVWREDELSEENGGGKRLTAVFRFSPEDGEKLRESLGKNGAPFEGKVDPESWFPPELAARSSTTGDETLKGKGYNANSFAKPPYTTGVIIHIDETDYYVLRLQTR